MSIRGTFASCVERIGSFFPRSRVAIASEINRLVTLTETGVGGDDGLRKLVTASRSQSRFERCLALEAIGRIGRVVPGSVETQIVAVSDPDPFVREAATSSVLRLLERGARPELSLQQELKESLSDLISRHVSEGASRHAVEALEFLSPGREQLDALEVAALAVNSSSRVQAQKLYNAIAGHPLKPLPPVADRVAVIRNAVKSKSASAIEEGVKVLRFTPFDDQVEDIVRRLFKEKIAANIKANVVEAVASNNTDKAYSFLASILGSDEMETVRFAAAIQLVRHRQSTKPVEQALPKFSASKQRRLRRELEAVTH